MCSCHPKTKQKVIIEKVEDKYLTSKEFKQKLIERIRKKKERRQQARRPA